MASCVGIRPSPPFHWRLAATSAATDARKMSATILMARSRTCRRGAVRSSSGSVFGAGAARVRDIPKRAVPVRRSLGIPTAGIPGRGQADAHGADGEHAHTHEEQDLFVGHVRSFLGTSWTGWHDEGGGPPLGVRWYPRRGAWVTPDRFELLIVWPPCNGPNEPVTAQTAHPSRPSTGRSSNSSSGTVDGRIPRSPRTSAYRNPPSGNTPNGS